MTTVDKPKARGSEAETVLAAATEKFIARFHALERELQREGGKLGEADLAALDAIWNRVKKAEPRP